MLLELGIDGLSLFLLGVLSGILLVILIQFLICRAYWKSLEFVGRLPKKPPAAVESHPDVKRFCETHERPGPYQPDNLPKESCNALNLMFAYLFRELKDTPPVKRWFLKMLNTDFQLLQSSSVAGKLIKRITVVDLNFGSSIPVLQGVTLLRPATGELDDSHELDLALDLDYKGNFHLTVEADLMLSKTAMVSVTFQELRGCMRLAFRRHPTLHFSASFMEDPFLKLEVVSLFESRDVPQISTLISNQIRRSIRKKHTLPAAKVRYKPFFPMPTDLTNANLLLSGRPLSEGQIRVKVVSARLQSVHPGRGMFCMLSLRTHETLDRAVAASMGESTAIEVVVPKDGPAGSIGIFFYDPQQKGGAEAKVGPKDPKLTARDSKLVRIETVTPNLPAEARGVRVGDVVTAVNGIAVLSSKQAVRLIREAVGSVTLRLLRDRASHELTAEEEEEERRNSLRTKTVDARREVAWQEEFDLNVTDGLPALYLRVYEFSFNKAGQKTGKGFLLGMATVDLGPVLAWCLTNRATCTQVFPLRQSQSVAAPEVGLIELQITRWADVKRDPQSGARGRAETAVDAGRGAAAAAGAGAGAGLGEGSKESGYAREPPAMRRDEVRHTADHAALGEPGQELFAELPPQERSTQLAEMATSVQTHLDLEMETRADLERQLEDASDHDQIERLRANLSESDKRRDMLMMRLLHCMSAIQQADQPL